MIRRGPQARSRAARLLPLVLVAASVAGGSGCGGNSGGGRLLSSKQAGDLRAKLNQIEQDVGAGNCTGAGDQVSALEGQIDSIRHLDGNLRSALRASAQRLDTLVSADCGTTSTPTQTQTTTTPQEGATGATGTTGQQGDGNGKPKKVPPGQAKKNSSGQGNGGGGAGLPGEGNGGGD